MTNNCTVIYNISYLDYIIRLFVFCEICERLFMTIVTAFIRFTKC